MLAVAAKPPITLRKSSLTVLGGAQMDELLTIAELAARLGRQPQTLHKYRSDSKPGRRYAATPFPEPDKVTGHMPQWRESRLPEIRAWMAARPGMGTGGGRPRKGRAAQ
jgi:hypothetical protein